MTALIVDSRRGGYLDAPDVEAGILEPLLPVELHRVDSAEELESRLPETDVLISWHHIALPRPILARLERCKGIVRASVGYDNIDVAAAHELGIPVCNVPDYGTEEVADHTLALLLALARRLPALDATVRRGDWQWQAIGPTPRLRGLTLGIVGLGRIGTAVARRARAFGLRVAFHDPYLPQGMDKALDLVRYDSLDELARDASFLSVHAPLTAETRGMVGDRQLQALGPDGVLINTARGEIVDQDALIAALGGGDLGAAGLDVLASEPEVPVALRESERVLLTAHSAFYSDASLEELRRKAAEAARNYALGRNGRNEL